MAFPLTHAEHRAIEASIQALPELIVAVAARTPLGTITRERPARHGDLWALLPKGLNPSDCDVVHGFMTSRGRFVDRQEAAKIVLASGQGTPRIHEGYAPALFSEDMWLDLFELSAAARPTNTGEEDKGHG
ncbi:MAG: hypothetical protein J7521_20100 [Caulobacter sp.]|nr:hypothetical protein [Caulobacter sp.]